MKQLGIKTWVLALCLVPMTAVAEFDHGPWDRLLTAHVRVFDSGRVTAVDYPAMAAARPRLRGYLEDLAAVSRAEFDGWSRAAQLAFLINAYNAWTVDLILSEYPGIDSIRDIGFLPGAAWRRDIVSLFGEQVSLDDVEHGMIRGWDRFQEPRIHFAVNCAAIGCPALRPEAYVASRLDAQLDDGTRLFLADRSRNYLDGDTAYLSRIFDWYEQDFERGWQGVNSVHEFLSRYGDALGANPSQQTGLASGTLRLRYLDYDWGLNAIAARQTDE